MISARYSIPVALLLVVALIPTVIHNYIGLQENDGLSIRNIANSLSYQEVRSSKKSPAWGKAIFGSEDWLERIYRIDNQDIVLFAARPYDIKKIYHHPELAISRGVDLKRAKVEFINKMPGVPLHVLRSRNGRGVAVYVLLYDGNYVENPILTQLMSSIQLLYKPRKMMTIIYVYDGALLPDNGIDTSAAIDILNKGMQNFLTSR